MTVFAKKQFLLTIFLSIASLSAFAETQVYEDGWQGTNGQVPIRFTTPDGKQYTGVLNCGQGV